MNTNRATLSQAKFGWEGVADLLTDPAIKDLIFSQWDELSGVKGRVPLDVDFEKMKQAEALGMFKVWTARQKGELVGLIEWQISPPWHHRTTLYAIDAGHYYNPCFRDRSWTYLRMWRTAEAALRKLGVKALMAHDNPKRPMVPFFKRLGFEPAGSLYVKVL